ncbi:P-loop containing nucleoside triphosphate hydrolase protein [Protomyces lactucae-debilis]|uniref:Ribosome-releasing factor 2, mitochondrial n=1 Tax=Protomyces lactucae-debilis TaxID=2754530 RepID=A0A1Y2FS53_PROLT|nr:P-loop containing nucleoside triphosphate hydrolase protein [Protomyces lactucae-debilis]ORY86407.1 P-loop containing nucleoside triphosphate hydrolase protein [Protomyces lactucae-debilis]
MLLPRLCSYCRHQTLLLKHARAASTASSAASASKIRNIGIIAHIDAGKTTTTERMLFYSGFIPRIGDVDEGNTVMDYLPAERERGITIQSAAITFPWQDHKFNLIDTPGHADFTFEVERSLRVLDGAITILDAVAGVEAQTEKVWRQANKRQIPRLVFVNKMDRTGAGFGRTIREVGSKLAARPLVMQLPIFEQGTDQGDFIGVVDLVKLECLVWPKDSDGRQVAITPLDQYANDALRREAHQARTAMVDLLSELDEPVFDAFMESEDVLTISAQVLQAAIKRHCLEGNLVPAFAGASFRNIGVQPLLNAVIDYLPSPDERPKALVVVKGNERALVNDDPPCALAFKVIIDAQRGPMVFVRVYSGTIARGTMLLNTTTKSRERALKVLQMYADEAQEAETVSAGNIAVILGLKDTRTGDTLVSTKDSKTDFHLQPIDVPPPVFMATLEATTASETKALTAALDNLLREDPSLRVTHDEDTAQTLLSGMGELHLEIAANRLVNEFKARATVGKLRIGYRETVIRVATKSDFCERIVNGKRGAVQMTIQLEPLPEDYMPGKHEVLVDGNVVAVKLPSSKTEFSKEEALLACQNGADIVLARGLILGYPLHGTKMTITVPEYDPDTTLASLVYASRSIGMATLQELGQDGMAMLEPIMSVAISVEESVLGQVMNDLSGTRGGHVLALDGVQNEDVPEQKSFYSPPDATMRSGSASSQSQLRTMQAKVPLREMVGYSRALRSLTGGRGVFVMAVDKFERMSKERVRTIDAW